MLHKTILNCFYVLVQYLPIYLNMQCANKICMDFKQGMFAKQHDLSGNHPGSKGQGQMADNFDVS